MKIALLSGFLLVALSPVLYAQQKADQSPAMPRDGREVFALAAPKYNFMDPGQRPWRIRVSYQYFGEHGAPATKGTLEYWWASPEVNHIRWSREGAEYSEWHLANRKQARVVTGAALNYFEFRLRDFLLAPIPGDADLDPAKTRIQNVTIKAGKEQIACYMTVPVGVQSPSGKTGKGQIPAGLFPTYCFDPEKPVLEMGYSLGGVAFVFSHMVQVQGHILAKQIDMMEGGRKLLTATVDEVAGISAIDPALSVPAELVHERQAIVTISNTVAQGLLIQKTQPIYPEDAKQERITGKVVLQAVIGRDGAIHDLHVVSAPWPSLAASAVWAVMQWHYKPYLLNNEPVEVDTIINVIYDIGG